MRNARRSVIAAVAVTSIAAAVWAPMALADDSYDDKGGSGLEAIGLAKDSLVWFNTDDPGKTKKIGKISGLDDDRKLVGIDFRVQDGKLYGVGDEGGVYTLDEDDAEATKVLDLTVDLEGEFFGVDFNPMANALRIISDTGQNLRQPFAPPAALPLLPAPTFQPTVADTPLTNPGGDTAEGVTGAAYTNNDLDATTMTQLFDLDTEKDRLSLQNPANAGTLTPVGDLGIDIGPNAGFDIFSTLENGVATANEAFGTVNSDGAKRLVSVDLENGEATDEGEFAEYVTDLAIELDN